MDGDSISFHTFLISTSPVNFSSYRSRISRIANWTQGAKLLRHLLLSLHMCIPHCCEAQQVRSNLNGCWPLHVKIICIDWATWAGLVLVRMLHRRYELTAPNYQYYRWQKVAISKFVCTTNIYSQTGAYLHTKMKLPFVIIEIVSAELWIFCGTVARVVTQHQSY